MPNHHRLLWLVQLLWRNRGQALHHLKAWGEQQWHNLSGGLAPAWVRHCVNGAVGTGIGYGITGKIVGVVKDAFKFDPLTAGVSMAVGCGIAETGLG